MFKFINEGERIVLNVQRPDDVKLTLVVTWVFVLFFSDCFNMSMNYFRNIAAKFDINIQ